MNVERHERASARSVMALTVYTSKDNAWREYVNPLRGMTLERIVQLIEQGERGSFADLQWFDQGRRC